MKNASERARDIVGNFIKDQRRERGEDCVPLWPKDSPYGRLSTTLKDALQAAHQQGCDEILARLPSEEDSEKEKWERSIQLIRSNGETQQQLGWSAAYFWLRSKLVDGGAR